MTNDTLTETYLFTPAWFKHYGNGSITQGIRNWWDDTPNGAYAPTDDENHTIFWAEYMALQAILTLAYKLIPGIDALDQVKAVQAHEAAHEPILGGEMPELEDEGRFSDGGLRHVDPEGFVDLKLQRVPYGDVMIPRGIHTSDERALLLGYEKLDVEREYKFFDGEV